MSEKDIIEKDIIVAYNTAMQKIRKLKEYAIVAADKNNKQLENALNEQKERLKQTKQEVADKDAQIDELIVCATVLARRVEENEKEIEGYKGLTKNILDIILECAKDTLNEDNYRTVVGMDNIKDMVYYMTHKMKQMAATNERLCKEIEELKNERVKESEEKESRCPDCIGDDVLKDECRKCQFIICCVELQALRHGYHILFHHDW